MRETKCSNLSGPTVHSLYCDVYINTDHVRRAYLIFCIIRIKFIVSTKFEHRTFTILAKISAYQSRDWYLCIYGMDNLFDSDYIYCHHLISQVLSSSGSWTPLGTVRS